MPATAPITQDVLTLPRKAPEGVTMVPLERIEQALDAAWDS